MFKVQGHRGKVLTKVVSATFWGFL